MQRRLILELFNSKQQTYKKAGFTLIEVLIAITILTFIALSTYVMVDKNVTTKETVLSEDDEFLQILTAMNRIDGDFSQFYSPLFFSGKNTTKTTQSNVYEDDSSFKNEYFDGLTEGFDRIPKFISEDKSTLIFFTSANRRKFANTNESRYMWVKYKLISMPADPDFPDKNVSGRYNLIRQVIADDIFNSALDWDKAKEQVLLENVKELSFSFWEMRNKKFTTTPADLGDLRNNPRLLKVEITWYDSSNNEKKFEKVSRVLTPYFDLNLDKNQKKQYQSKNGQGKTSQENGQSSGDYVGGNPDPTEEIFE